ncbi:hypothetical protein BDR26DRAFT_842127 [Obelidium mucronatum]|nr:hypothetical protein BDR26DRAFT_842127 [Obelidium mucronatum]
MVATGAAAGTAATTNAAEQPSATRESRNIYYALSGSVTDDPPPGSGFWAMTNLALIYSEGNNGVKPKLKEAVRLLRMAAEQDHVRAQAKLAQCLLNGVGCPESKEEAFEWFTQAADGGSVAAMFALGQCFENGDGCNQDLRKAIDCYSKAASWGDEKASDRLIALVANPSVLDGMFEHGYIAPAA